MTDIIVVLATAGSSAEAAAIARKLVDAAVAACVNIVPGVRSIYRWKGNVEEAEEFLLVIKTRRSQYARLQEELKSAHSYETPEILALPVESGYQPYLDWVRRETSIVDSPERL